MSRPAFILLARLLIPVVLVVFGVSFYLNVDAMARSEKLFPIVLIGVTVSLATTIGIREIAAFVVIARRRHAADVAARALDTGGLCSVGWKRSTLIAGACLLYLFGIESLGLMLTGFLVYMICAATLIPDKSAWKHWLAALIGGAVAGVLFDSVFRIWLGLPLPGL